MSNRKQINLDHLMMLARIGLTEDEKRRIEESLSLILEYFQEIENIDVTNVEESAHAYPLYNILREDEPGDLLTQEEALLNAPAKLDNQFVVPKIVE